MDVVQDLIDRKVATFVLIGSSARKLRRGSAVNLLPGRLLAMRLDPLVLAEAAAARLEDVLLHGSLPGIVTEENAAHREQALQSYVTLYLEEEVRPRPWSGISDRSRASWNLRRGSRAGG